MNEKWCAICTTNSHNTDGCYYNGRGSRSRESSSWNPPKKGKETTVAVIQSQPADNSTWNPPANRGQGGGRGRGRGGRGFDRPKTCLFCMEEGHWRSECLEAQEYDRRKGEKAAGKQPSVSMVHVDALSVDGPEVAIVTRSGKTATTHLGKQSAVPEWPAQEAVRKKAVSWMHELAPEIKDSGHPASALEMRHTSQKDASTTEAAWQELYAAPLQIRLGSLLQLVPNFHKGLLDQGKLYKPDIHVGNAEPDDAPPLLGDRITDTRIPELSMRYHGTYIDKVLLDGGCRSEYHHAGGLQ